MKDKRIDAYIENAKPFAKCILNHLRDLIHQTCPEVQETIKWGFPHFEYKGLLCSLAAFQEHCSFGFWKEALMQDPHQVMGRERGNGMGHFGRLTCIEDLPEDSILMKYLHEAMQLNEKGISLPKKKPKASAISIPEDLTKALQENPQANNQFNKFTPGKKNEYVAWIEEARQEATRKKRLNTAIEWIAEGKSKNWKYEKC